MKKAFLFIILLAFQGTHVFSQENVNQRLIDFLGKEKFDFLSENHPKQIQFQTYKLLNSYQLIDYQKLIDKKIKPEIVTTISFKNKNGKTYSLSSKEVLSAIENKTFNILTSNIHPYKTTDRYLLLEGTGKVLVVYSEEKTTSNYANSIMRKN